jgi:hypothetical protein
LASKRSSPTALDLGDKLFGRGMFHRSLVEPIVVSRRLAHRRVENFLFDLHMGGQRLTDLARQLQFFRLTFRLLVFIKPAFDLTVVLLQQRYRVDGSDLPVLLSAGIFFVDGID